MKTICIYHSRDLDGWMSAAIVKHWAFKESLKSDKPFGEIEFLGWDYGDSIPDLSEYDKVIMCDISFPKEEMNELLGKLTWIDHHKSAIKLIEPINMSKEYAHRGLRDANFAACELTWKYFFPNKQMPEIVRLLGLYDSFRHKGTDEEQKVLEFQYGARQAISNYEEAYNYLIDNIKLDKEMNECEIDYDRSVEGILDAGKVIYKYLCTEAEQTYNKAFEVEFVIPRFPDGYDEEFKFLCVNQERFNPVNFGIDYHKDGYDGFACFWYKDGKWAWSLYNDNGKVDCSSIAQQYGGGGHFSAAGMVVDTETLLKIINEN